MTVTIKLVVTVLVTISGASFQFYNFSVLNTAQVVIEEWVDRTFKERDGQGISKNSLTIFWSFTVSSICFGALLGSLMTSVIAERVGRRNGLVLSAWIGVLGGICQLSARPALSPEILMVGRCLMGICMGLNCGIAPLYLTEIAPVRLRGTIGVTHQIASSFGDVSCMVISLPMVLGGRHLWPLAVTLASISAFLLCMILPFCPESPRYLLFKLGDRQRAAKAIQGLVGCPEETESLLQGLDREIAAAQITSGQHHSFIAWFRLPELFKATIIVIIVMFGQQFTAIAAVLSYSSDIFRQADLPNSVAQFSTAGIGFCYFLCTLPSMWIVESHGRRFLSILQLSGCLVCLILLSVCIGLNKYLDLHWASYGSIAVMAVYTWVYGIGSPIPWIMASELFSQEYRSTAVSIGTFTSFGLAFVISTMYLPVIESWGPVLCFLPFIITLSLVLLGVILFMPETKERDVHDIVEEFRNPHVIFYGLHKHTPSALLNHRNPSSPPSLGEKNDGVTASKSED